MSYRRVPTEFALCRHLIAKCSKRIVCEERKKIRNVIVDYFRGRDLQRPASCAYSHGHESRTNDVTARTVTPPISFPLVPLPISLEKSLCSSLDDVIARPVTPPISFARMPQVPLPVSSEQSLCSSLGAVAKEQDGQEEVLRQETHCANECMRPSTAWPLNDSVIRSYGLAAIVLYLRRLCVSPLKWVSLIVPIRWIGSYQVVTESSKADNTDRETPKGKENFQDRTDHEEAPQPAFDQAADDEALQKDNPLEHALSPNK